MNGEEMTILNNMMSLLSELKQIEGGEEENTVNEELAQAGDELQPKNQVTMKKCVKKNEDADEDDKKDDEEKDMKEVMKELITTETDGPTAGDDMEDRLEEVDTTVNEDSVDEVAKALLRMLKNQSVKKSAKASPVSKEVSALTKVVKALSERVIEQDKALTNVFKGLGIADEIVKKQENLRASQPVQKAMNNSDDVNKSLAYIINHLNGSKEVQKTSDMKPIDEVRKTLGNRSILSALVTGK